MAERKNTFLNSKCMCRDKSQHSNSKNTTQYLEFTNFSIDNDVIAELIQTKIALATLLSSLDEDKYFQQLKPNSTKSKFLI